MWGFPWQSNPYCRIEVGSQSFRSRKEDATSHAGSHRAPVWNQEFQFLVEDPGNQVGFHNCSICLVMHGIYQYERRGRKVFTRKRQALP